MVDKKWWILIGASIAMMLVAIDFTIVNTSLANIQRDLHTNVKQLQWVMAAFAILFSSMVVTMGRLCDIKGRRKFIYTGIIGFGLASLGAGLTSSIQFLIAMRALQGLCGAAIFPSGMAITTAAFPPEQQGRALGIYGSLIGIGFAIGPVLGSLIITFLNWRWIFFINLPVVVLSLAICLPTISESKHPAATKVDWPGTITMVIFLGALVFAMTEGPYYGWNSAVIIGGFFIALITFLGFIFIEKRTSTPILPVQLFINRGCLLGGAIYFATLSLNWAVMFMMPLYLHHQLKLATGPVGLLLFPMTIMTVIVPFIAGYWLDKRSPLTIIHLPFLLSVVSLFLFTLFNHQGPIALIIIAFVLYGAAWGIGNGIAIPIALSQLPDVHDHGLVSGGVVTLMNLLGVVIFTIVMLLFRYGQKISFLYGFHIACYALLVVPIFFWLLTIIIMHGKSSAKAP